MYVLCCCVTTLLEHGIWPSTWRVCVMWCVCDVMCDVCDVMCDVMCDMMCVCVWCLRYFCKHIFFVHRSKKLLIRFLRINLVALDLFDSVQGGNVCMFVSLVSLYACAACVYVCAMCVHVCTVCMSMSYVLCFVFCTLKTNEPRQYHTHTHTHQTYPTVTMNSLHKHINIYMLTHNTTQYVYDHTSHTLPYNNQQNVRPY